MEFAVILGLVAVATVFGLVWKRGQGRVVAVSGQTISLDYRVAGKTTLLQFTTELCAPCAQLKPRLEQIALYRSDVEHVVVDAVEHLDLANNLSVRSTPTTFIIGPEGEIRARIHGVAPAETFINAIDGKTVEPTEEISI
jgi:thiol-disulfide isomerase/thioredoxin